MWCRNPFDKDGWWGKDGNWYNSGYCNFTFWAAEKGEEAYRNTSFINPFIQKGQQINCFAQLAMFHGAMPNPGFPPLSFYPQS